MSNTRSLPTLYYLDPKGNIREWTVWTEGPVIYTEYGLVQGAKQVSKKIATAKNVGRSNETTPEEQAQLQAQALWEHKRTRSYAEDPNHAVLSPVILPMKLHTFEKQSRKIMYPAYVQPKLDGFRAMAIIDPDDPDEVVFLSRSGRIYKVPHLEKELFPLFEYLGPQHVFDGEFYLHKRLTFEQLSSLIKRNRKESEVIEYHVFDITHLKYTDLMFKDRLTIIRDLFLRHSPERIVPVETLLVDSLEEVETQHAKYKEQGYEGSVVRNATGMYKFNYRSHDALKIKDFLDGEYQIVGWDTGVGKFENAVIWICRTAEGKQFRVVPVGSFEERAEMLDQAEHQIGKLLTVSYLNLTADGIPRHPVGIRIREEE